MRAQAEPTGHPHLWSGIQFVLSLKTRHCKAGSKPAVNNVEAINTPFVTVGNLKFYPVLPGGTVRRGHLEWPRHPMGRRWGDFCGSFLFQLHGLKMTRDSVTTNTSYSIQQNDLQFLKMCHLCSPTKDGLASLRQQTTTSEATPEHWGVLLQ